MKSGLKMMPSNEYWLYNEIRFSATDVARSFQMKRLKERIVYEVRCSVMHKKYEVVRIVASGEGVTRGEALASLARAESRIESFGSSLKVIFEETNLWELLLGGDDDQSGILAYRDTENSPISEWPKERNIWYPGFLLGTETLGGFYNSILEFHSH